ncbi:MAG TPA: DUF3005 domain-containing protein [Paraburkholderia sp.]|jgi:hypothetical protein
MNPIDADKPTHAQSKTPGTTPLSAELHNDRTHDSTVDTDGKNREAARLAGDGVIGPDEVTTSNATLDNSVPEAADGLAGFDSRAGGNHLLLALEPGYSVVEKGMSVPQYEGDYTVGSPGRDTHLRYGGRIHYALNHRRPNRIIELQRVK